MKRPRPFRKRIKTFLIVIGIGVAALAVWTGMPGHGKVVAESIGDEDGPAAPTLVANQINPTRISGTLDNGLHWTLVQPIIDNRIAFKRYFPDGKYKGDVGDPRHQNAHPPQDHTPRSVDSYKGTPPTKGWIYAQDFGEGGGFDHAPFACWLLGRLRHGYYPEVKYVITQAPANRNNPSCYGNFRRVTGWRHENRPKVDHDDHIHISYMMTCPGFFDMEHHHSTIIADYAAFLGRS